MNDPVIIGKATLYRGDCLDVMRTMPDNSVDSIVTDPPYELSSDGKQSASRVFLEFAFPQNTKIETHSAGSDALPLFVSKVLGLGGVRNVPSPSATMPVIAVALNDDSTLRQHEIEHASESAIGISGDCAISNIESEAAQHLGCFTLKLADTTRLFQVLNGVGAGFISGGLGIGLAGFSPSLPCLQPSSSSVVITDEHIRRTNDTLANLIGAFTGTTSSPVLRFDLGRNTVEQFSADGARLFAAILLLTGAELVRTDTTASSLPTMLETRRISVIDDFADRAFTFDLVVHAQSIASNGFMGKHWDGSKAAYNVEVWAEALRVLKPGGHLLSFSSARTYHRMVCGIEDAGFEIRDMIAWVYSSGFPKSLNVSKAIDKAAGAEREVIGEKVRGDVQAAKQNGVTMAAAEANRNNEAIFGYGVEKLTIPATDAAKQWDGWGTALKPALETVTLALKPFPIEAEQGIIKSNLLQLEARLWLLSHASAAEQSLMSSQKEYAEALSIAQWTVEKSTSTQGVLCEAMDMSQYELATNTSLSIVSSWLNILADLLNDGSMSTIGMRSSTTIDWKTLNFCLSQITPESIIKACSLQGGFNANAGVAESHFNASLSLLQSTRILSATEPVISLEVQNFRGADVSPNLDPVIMARKPFTSTVAANVLQHGTGAINIDGCRVAIDQGADASQLRTMQRNQREGGDGWGMSTVVGDQPQVVRADGRWPANLIHDGSEEVLALFPDSTSGAMKAGTQRAAQDEPGSVCYGTYGGNATSVPIESSSGSAARFYYCAKASKEDRNEGLDGFELREAGIKNDSGRGFSETDPMRKIMRANHHPTVKPTDLMRYLCRLVTPPGGVVLDPFLGSGSTGKAAILEGFRFIGIEQDEDENGNSLGYIDIAAGRIEHAIKVLDENTAQHEMFV